MNLKEACALMGIDLILSDLDDTLVRTNAIFIQQMVYCTQVITTGMPSVTEDEFNSVINGFNKQAYHSHGVGRDMWKEVLRLLKTHYSVDTHLYLTEAIAQIEKVYTIVPLLREGANDLLTAIYESELLFGILTHADEEWTQLKAHEHNLNMYTRDRVKIVPPHEHKGVPHWTEAIESFHVDPSRVFIMGDSLQTDVIPAYKAGVRKIIWVDNSESWHLYREGALPPGVLTVSHLNEVIPLLLSCPWN